MNSMPRCKYLQCVGKGICELYSLERGLSDLGSGEVLLGSLVGSFVDGGSLEGSADVTLEGSAVASLVGSGVLTSGSGVDGSLVGSATTSLVGSGLLGSGSAVGNSLAISLVGSGSAIVEGISFVGSGSLVVEGSPVGSGVVVKPAVFFLLPRYLQRKGF